MTQRQKIQLFEDKKVRVVWDDELQEWFFSVVDAVEVLTDSKDPKDYLKKIRKRDPELDAYVGTNCPLVSMSGTCPLTSGVSMTPQRCMYVLYLSYYKKRKDYATIIKEIELFAQEYKEDNKLDRAVSRVFIYAPFKKALDKRYGISECDLLNLE